MYKDKLSYNALHEITFHFDGVGQFHIYLFGDTSLNPREGFRGDAARHIVLPFHLLSCLDLAATVEAKVLVINR